MDVPHGGEWCLGCACLRKCVRRRFHQVGEPPLHKEEKYIFLSELGRTECLQRTALFESARQRR